MCQNVSATSQEGSSPRLKRHKADGTFVYDRGILIQTSQALGENKTGCPLNSLSSFSFRYINEKNSVLFYLI